MTIRSRPWNPLQGFWYGAMLYSKGNALSKSAAAVSSDRFDDWVGASTEACGEGAEAPAVAFPGSARHGPLVHAMRTPTITAKRARVPGRRKSSMRMRSIKRSFIWGLHCLRLWQPSRRAFGAGSSGGGGNPLRDL